MCLLKKKGGNKFGLIHEMSLNNFFFSISVT